MTIASRHLVEQQIPFHIREGSQLLTKFLEYYYEFIEQQKINEIIQDLQKYHNVDTADEAILRNFFEEVRTVLPASTVSNKRLSAKHINELYQSKGTVDAVKLLFNMVFGDVVSVTYPYDNVLKASDGKWIQENYFTLERAAGTSDGIEDKDLILVVSNADGFFSIDVRNIIKINSITLRISYNNIYFLRLNDGDVVKLYEKFDTELQNAIFTGIVKQTASTVRIVDGGKNWRIGQIITIPGSIANTILQVTATDSVGTITKLSVYETGYVHASNQTAQVSPFAQKPPGTGASITKTLVSIDFSDPENPIYSYQYDVVIDETTNGITESTIGTSTTTSGTYFLQDYVSEDYVAETLFIVTTSQTSSNETEYVDPDLTLDEWNASLATITLSNSVISKSRGYFQAINGKLSEPEIHLQDNLLYQKFSYIIGTSISIDAYRKIIDKIHPAGLKYFGTLIKDYDLSITSDIQLSASVSDGTAASTLNKYIDDEVVVSETMTFDLATDPSFAYSNDDYFADDGYFTPEE